MKSINSFDCDGVITLGIYPGPNDIIITGRSFEESEDTLQYLSEKGINNVVYFNPLKFDDKTRESSGLHKVNILNSLSESGIVILAHFEDDPIQIREIENNLKYKIRIIRIDHSDAINMENISHKEHMENM